MTAEATLMPAAASSHPSSVIVTPNSPKSVVARSIIPGM